MKPIEIEDMAKVNVWWWEGNTASDCMDELMFWWHMYFGRQLNLRLCSTNSGHITHPSGYSFNIKRKTKYTFIVTVWREQ